jgi:hypothetical protein
VKFSRLILVFLLLGTVVCVASVPPVDDPETVIDESDFQISLAIPAPINSRLVQPIATSVQLPKPSSETPDLRANPSSLEFVLMPKHARAHSLQKLLCTFLI